jgi:hypothetical protein
VLFNIQNDAGVIGGRNDALSSNHGNNPDNSHQQNHGAHKLQKFHFAPQTEAIASPDFAQTADGDAL